MGRGRQLALLATLTACGRVSLDSATPTIEASAGHQDSTADAYADGEAHANDDVITKDIDASRVGSTGTSTACTGASTRVTTGIVFSTRSSAVAEAGGGAAPQASADELYVTDYDATALYRVSQPLGGIYTGVGQFALAPDGAKVAYIMNQTGNCAFYVADLTTCAIQQLSRVIPIRSPDAGDASGCAAMQWSPDGSRIAYTDGAKLYTTMADGSDSVMVAASSFDFKWSPNSGRIAYAGPNGSLGIVDARGGNATTIVDPEVLSLSGIAWAPDSSRVGYIWQTRFAVDLYTVLAGGGASVRVNAPMTFSGGKFAFTPDGSEIFFSTVNDQLKFGLSQGFSAGGGVVELVAPSLLVPPEPVVSPDGAGVCFLAYSGNDHTDLLCAPAADGSVKRISTENYVGYWGWGNGSTVAYTSSSTPPSDRYDELDIGLSGVGASGMKIPATTTVSSMWWSWDRRKIAYWEFLPNLDDYSYRHALHVTSPAGNDDVTIHDRGVNDPYATPWSTDGHLVYYVRSATGPSDDLCAGALYAALSDGSRRARLTPLSTCPDANYAVGAKVNVP